MTTKEGMCIGSFTLLYLHLYTCQNETDYDHTKAPGANENIINHRVGLVEIPQSYYMISTGMTVSSL